MNIGLIQHKKLLKWQFNTQNKTMKTTTTLLAKVDAENISVGYCFQHLRIIIEERCVSLFLTQE